MNPALPPLRNPSPPIFAAIPNPPALYPNDAPVANPPIAAPAVCTALPNNGTSLIRVIGFSENEPSSFIPNISSSNFGNCFANNSAPIITNVYITGFTVQR